MVFRITQRLAKKINIKSIKNYEQKVSAFEEWYANLFNVGRYKYILITNAYSLYSVIISAKGINDGKSLVSEFNDQLLTTMKKDNLRFLINRFSIKNNTTIDFCKTSSKRILGSMNDMTFLCSYRISETMDLLEASRIINKTPFSYLNYQSPLDVIQNMSLS